MYFLFLIAGLSFAERNIERDFRIAESATIIGGTFAVVSTVSYRRAKKIEDQMLRESNNFSYNELLQTYKGHRSQYIVAVPATILFSGLAVALYTRRNIQKSNFFTSSPQRTSNFTDASSTSEVGSEKKMNQRDVAQRESSDKESLQRYKKIVDFWKKEDFLQESQNDTKPSDQSANEQRTSEELENNKESEKSKESETNKKTNSDDLSQEQQETDQ